jgi:hypothetical protein
MGKRHKHEQEKVKEFSHQNPTPARPTTIKENGDDKPKVTFVCSADAAPDANGITAATAAAAATAPTTMAGRSAIGLPGKEFYDQLIVTMKIFAAPQHQQKIVVESREHEESIDLAKLQTSMLQLMYASGEINWDKGTVTNIQLATFAQGYKNLLDGSATVQATQLANLYTSVFLPKPTMTTTICNSTLSIG